MTVKGYFQFDDEQFSVAIVTKVFHDANPDMLDDSGSEKALVPDGFYELSDAIYEHDYDSHEEAVEALNKAGLEEKQFLNI